MQTKNTVTVQELQRRISSAQSVFLLDVRSPVEYSAAHISGTKLIPLDELNPRSFEQERGADSTPVYVICQSGGRAKRAVEMLQGEGVKECVLLEGGIQAWMDAGLPVVRGESRVLPLMRQVQIVVGLISASGALLALVVNPRFAIIPLLTGCGLLFAGITGFCGLAVLLARMPWNKAGNCKTGSCCSSDK